MLGRKGCWTLPQLLMELESKVKTLENAHYYAYQHALHCQGSDGTDGQIFYLTLVTADNAQFTGTTLTEYLLANSGAGYNATGYTADDDAVIGLEVDGNDIRLKLPNSDSSTITNIQVLSDTVTTIQVK